MMQLRLFTVLFVLLFVSCGKEDLEEPEIFSTHFSDADLDILTQTLYLNSKPYNYAKPDLPAHYNSDEAAEANNTPEHNQITNMGATLGRVLFYDKQLSANNTISCASCHEQKAAFSDNRRFSIGLNGEKTRRNSMGLVNSRYYENGRFFWDERAATLEEQVLMPIVDHIEMGMDLSELEQKLANLDYYPVLFRNAFGTEDITADRIAKALSQFSRSIVPIDSKYDQGLEATKTLGEEDNPDFPNFTAQENLGMDIFFRGRKGATCVYCHGGPMNINDEAKNNGLGTYNDQGKGEITGKSSDMATFKVPSLRNIAQTGPYMHDGRFETLMDVVNHYSDNVQPHPNLDFRLTTNEKRGGKVLRLNLTPTEKEALVAFLETLTDENILTSGKWSDPFR